MKEQLASDEDDDTSKTEKAYVPKLIGKKLGLKDYVIRDLNIR